MTAQSSIPLKWYVPFANNDSSRVELPVTTSDPTRASQSLGFPPLTMQPPESGGVPPQGEDFNGGMNQVARICWWLLNGGGYPFDSIFAANSNINGYPNGATLQSADFLGQWISVADNNQNNPDVSGTSWVPGFQYGITSLTGLTGGTVTPTPAQAAKRAITLAGTLTSALTIILPTWLKDWTITNGTSGAFVTIVKTLAGSGITIPQNAQPTRVSGDGTNIVQAAENIAAATNPTNAMQFGQATGRLLRVTVYQNNSGTLQSSVNGSAFANASSTFTPLALTTSVEVEVCGGGGGGGGSQTTSSSQFAAGSGGGAGGWAKKYLTSGFSGITITAGAAGAAGLAGNSGGTGGTSSFGAIASGLGGTGGSLGTALAFGVGAAGQASGGSSSGGDINSQGGMGKPAFYNSGTILSGEGGASVYGGGAPFVSGTSSGVASLSYGAGGSGGCVQQSNGSGANGGAGKSGLVIVREYA